MSYLKERVAYLRGLAEGMQINDATNEGKLLKAMLEVMDDIALAVDDIEEVQEQLSEQVDNIDEDLAEIESALFDDEECDCDCEDDDDMCFAEIKCPYCDETINVDEDMIDETKETIECPSCHKTIELDWDCDCGCHDHE